MGMAADELLIDVPGNVIEVEMPALLGQQRVEDHLDEHVAQFLAHMGHVALVDRFEQLAALVDQAAGQGLVGLLLVPGTAILPPQAGHGFSQIVDRAHRPNLNLKTPKITKKG